MKMNYYNLLAILLTASLLFACNSEPKVVESESTTPSETKAVLDNAGEKQHTVVVKEVLQADKYTYLSVTEDDGEPFWIAVTKRPVKEGATFQYTGGLLKKNFYSREFDRVFETIYLVSGVRQANNAGGSALDQAVNEMQKGQVKPVNIDTPADAVSLKDLFNNPQKYAGKTIKVKGQCVKVNNQIMERNWVHLQDGSKDEDGESIDLTVTTNEQIMVGQVVTMEGTIALNRDFGAGYFYDVIMEGAKKVE